MIKKFTIFILLIPFFIGAQETYILNYDDVDYVVQQGDLIDNTYRLISVSKEEIVFDRAGKQMYIKMD